MNIPKINLTVAIAMLLCAFIPASCAQAQTADYECMLEWTEHPLHPLAPHLKMHTDTLITFKDIASYLYFNGDPASLIPDKTQSRYVLFPNGRKTGIIGKSYPLLSQKKSSQKVNIDFKYKTKQLCHSCMHIYAIGDGEQYTEVDSIPLSLTDVWTEVHKVVTLHTPCYLHVELAITGVSADCDTRFFIDKLMISSRGKSLKEMPFGYKTKPFKRSAAISLDSLMTSPILDKKILGLGETTHGTVTLQDIAFDIMKERILHHSCSLILFEIPLEMSFAINRYVKNDERFHLEDIKKMLGEDLYSESTVSFLQWVKEYNQSHNNVVSVLGMDSTTDYAAELFLNDFVEVLDSTKSGIWHPLCFEILTASWSDPLSVFEADNSIKKELTCEEIELVRYSLKNLVQRRSDKLLTTRDITMPVTANLIMDLYKPHTVTIHAHFGHLNYISNTNNPLNHMVEAPSAGHILKQTYKNDYACIALSGENCKNYDWLKMAPQSLEQPPSESLEYTASLFNENIVYLPMDCYEGASWRKIRFVGSAGTEGISQFTDIVPKERMDGIIVVEDVLPIPSRPFTAPEQIIRSNQRHKELFDKYLQEKGKWKTQQQSNVTLVAVNKKNDTVADSDSIYFACDEMPEMHGGTSAMMDYLQRNIRYPQEALDAKKEGVVLVHFIVEKDGSISNPEVKMSVDPSLDAEAVRVITSMPKWKPGKQDGKPVRVYYNIPVRFILNAPQSAPDAQAPGYRA